MCVKGKAVIGSISKRTPFFPGRPSRARPMFLRRWLQRRLSVWAKVYYFPTLYQRHQLRAYYVRHQNIPYIQMKSRIQPSLIYTIVWEIDTFDWQITLTGRRWFSIASWLPFMIFRWFTTNIPSCHKRIVAGLVFDQVYRFAFKQYKQHRQTGFYADKLNITPKYCQNYKVKKQEVQCKTGSSNSFCSKRNRCSAPRTCTLQRLHHFQFPDSSSFGKFF